MPLTTVAPELVAINLKQSMPDNASAAGYKLMRHRVNVKLHSTEGDFTEVLFIGRNRAVKLQMPPAVALFVLENAARFEINSTSPIMYNEVVRQFAAYVQCKGAELVMEIRWQWWRKEVVWLKKT